MLDRSIKHRDSYDQYQIDCVESLVQMNHLISAVLDQLNLDEIPISVLWLSPEAKAVLNRTRAKTITDIEHYCKNGDLGDGNLAVYDEICRALQPWGIDLD